MPTTHETIVANCRPVGKPVTERQQLGRYELLTRIAVGGMAEVFIARERGLAGLERTVVIKQILPQYAEQPSFVEMFLREARIIARLNHPNVVQIIELDESDGVYYIVMEHIFGMTARKLLQLAEQAHRRITPSVAAAIAAQACQGLHAAHVLVDLDGTPLGIVHRDINPHNLMITPDGFVKLLDFGIAKSTVGAEATYTGTLKGKFSYMSPEQCDNQPVDQRTDVFSMGIVLWELLTHRPLFKRDSEIGMVRAVLEESVPLPSTVDPAIPSALEDVAMKALAKDKEKRFESAEQMRSTLLKACESARIEVTADRLSEFVRDVAGDYLKEQRLSLAESAELSRSSEDSDDWVPEEPDPSKNTIPGPFRSFMRRITPNAMPAVSDDETDSPARKKLNTQMAARQERIVFGLLFVVFIGFLTIVFWGTGENEPVLGLEDVGVQRTSLSGYPLPLGWPPYVDADLMLQEMESFQVYLEDTIQQQVPFVVADSYSDCVEQLLSGDLAFASLPPGLFVRAQEQEPALEVLAIQEFDGAVRYDGLLLVDSTTAINSVAELEGETFCLTNEDSTSGYLLPRYFLRRLGYDPDQFIGSVHWSGQHSQVLRDLLDGRCAAAATYNGAYFSASDSGLSVGRLRIIAVTGSLPQDAIVASPFTTVEERDRLRQALLDFDPVIHVGQQRVGGVQRITGFSEANQSDYQLLRDMLTAEDPEE